MKAVRGALGIVDRAHLPPPGATNATAYKEWYHFNVIDPDGAVDLIINFSLAGDVRSTRGGRTDLIALAHVGGNVWHGGIDRFEATATLVGERELDLAIGASSVHCRDDIYRIVASTRDGALACDVSLSPCTEPMLVWNDTPVGSGSINWLIVPHLLARGSLRAGAQQYAFSDSCAYHDHNWGYWRWGEDLAWIWGFATDMATEADAGRTTLVFDRTSDRSDAYAMEQTLALWQDEKLGKLFMRRMLRARKEGRFTAHVDRVPGPMNLIASGQVLDVPATLRLSARDGEDWLDAVYRVDAAVQIAIPAEFGFGVVGLNETFGTMEVTGAIAGSRVGFHARACVEFM